MEQGYTANVPLVDLDREDVLIATHHDGEAARVLLRGGQTQIVAVTVKRGWDQDGAIHARPIHQHQQFLVAQGNGKVGAVFHPFAPRALRAIGGPDMHLRIDDDNGERSLFGDLCKP